MMSSASNPFSNEPAKALPMTPPEGPLTTASMLEWLKPIEDPEIFMSLVELGLIYECNINTEAGAVAIKMTLTTPSCPAAGYLVEQVQKRAQDYPGVKEAKVELVFEPKWDPHTMASEEAKERLGLW
jgi:metal-sulfur cluster biosynthetic enzyme